MSDSQSVNKILEYSRSCTEQSNYERGIFWILNGLGHYPGNMSLLMEAKNIITSLTEILIQRDNNEEAEQRLAWLGRVFQEQVSKVTSEDLLQLLDWMDELNEQIIALNTIEPPDAQIQPEEIEDQARLLLEEVEEADLTFSTIPSEIKELEDEFEKMGELVDRIEAFELNPKKVETLPRIKNYMVALRTAKQYKDVHAEVEKVFQYIENSLKKPEAVYLIQHVDGMLRQLVLLASSLDEEWQEETTNLLDRLRKLDAEREKETVTSERDQLLKHFVSKINKNISQIYRSSTKKQEKLKKIESLMKEIQDFRTQNPWCLTEEKSMKLEKSIQQNVQKITKEQHQLYNQWAIRAIKSALEEGKSEKGIVLDNKAAIADAMIKHLGEVDTRFLTMEVNRMYSEVFEYLYKTLKGPKNSQDFEDNSKKLGVLKKMYDKPCRDLTAF